MKTIIENKLKEIEEKENVKIIMAVESGSRAWGFESPDSDYDVRFIYVRDVDDYLRLDEMRDVIEWQLDDVLDINGWDIKKALRLLYKSNPTVFEWCASPIVYRTSSEFEKIKELLPKYFSKKKGLLHYYHMAESNYREYLKVEQVKVKKYFYVLRPIFAAKWILDKECPPPMLFSKLMESELENSIRPEVDKLLKMKQELPEIGLSLRVQVLNDYIEAELSNIKEKAKFIEEDEKTWNLLNDYFVSLVKLNKK